MGTRSELSRSWPAPAKLNLFLHITGRRTDGYHTLQTVFQFLDYADSLRFTVTADGRIRRAVPVSGVSEERDLTVRAARLLQAHGRIAQGAIIQLEKRIPTGGGLGGGSSDAATTLLALNELWELRLPRAQLAALSLDLGADVPVFVHGRAAWAEGIGEILTPVEIEEPWYVVLAPPAHVSTAEVYADSELTRHSPPITIRDFRAGRTGNDMESVVRRRYPQVDQGLRFLTRFGQPRMTGSGGCVFLKVMDAGEGKRILADAPRGFTGFVARGVNVHPLYNLRSGGSDWGVAKR